jgi:mono/diheme cytochrome c family protein
MIAASAHEEIGNAERASRRFSLRSGEIMVALGAPPAADVFAFEEAMKRSLAMVAFLPFLLASSPSARAQEAQEVAQGRAIALKVCAACHVAAEDQAQAPQLKPPAPPFAEIAARPDVTEPFLREFLMKPHGEARALSAMPRFLVPGRETDAVIAYLMSLRPKP